MRVSPPAENQDYGSHVSPAPQDDTGGGGGAPTNAEYVVISLDATLTNERRLQATTPIVLTDGGANADATLTHATSGVAAATYGSATQVPVFATNATGHVTSVTNTTIASPGASANFTALFGSGAAGTVTFDGVGAVTGFSLVGTTYTCTATAGGGTEYVDATVNVGVEVRMANRFISCTGTLTCNGTISNRGNDASGSTGPTTNGALDYYATNQAGQAGRTAAQLSLGNLGNAIGGTAGLGGTSPAQAAQAAAAVPSAPSSVNGGILSAYTPDSVMKMRNAVGTSLAGGSAGNAGSGDNTNTSGAGGAGGGVLGVYARIIAGSGTLSAKGGNGGTPALGNCGGGAGGGGGVLAVVTTTANWPSVVTGTVAGGTKGGPSGTGNNNATDGAVGRIISMIV